MCTCDICSVWTFT